MPPFIEEFYEEQTFQGLKHENEQVAGVTFLNCSFTNCSFNGTALRACKFQGCQFKRCDLSLIKVDQSAFTGVQFVECKVIGVNWVAASWGKKELQQLLKSIDFVDCVLNYSTFMGLNLEQMLLKKCIAHEVDFSEANLTRADCTFTDFTNSRFRRTDLTGADFTGATDYFIQPHLNTLKQTRFSLPEALSLLYNLDIVITDPSSPPAQRG